MYTRSTALTLTLVPDIAGDSLVLLHESRSNKLLLRLVRCEHRNVPASHRLFAYQTHSHAYNQRCLYVVTQRRHTAPRANVGSAANWLACCVDESNRFVACACRPQLERRYLHQLLLATLHVRSRVEMLSGERHYALVLQTNYIAAKFAEITTQTYLTSAYNQLLVTDHAVLYSERARLFCVAFKQRPRQTQTVSNIRMRTRPS